MSLVASLYNCGQCGKNTQTVRIDTISYDECLQCYEAEYNPKQEFINRAEVLYPDLYDYSEFNYINATTPGIIKIKNKPEVKLSVVPLRFLATYYFPPDNLNNYNVTYCDNNNNSDSKETESVIDANDNQTTHNILKRKSQPINTSNNNNNQETNKKNKWFHCRIRGSHQCECPYACGAVFNIETTHEGCIDRSVHLKNSCPNLDYKSKNDYCRIRGKHQCKCPYDCGAIFNIETTHEFCQSRYYHVKKCSMAVVKQHAITETNNNDNDNDNDNNNNNNLNYILVN